MTKPSFYQRFCAYTWDLFVAFSICLGSSQVFHRMFTMSVPTTPQASQMILIKNLQLCFYLFPLVFFFYSFFCHFWMKGKTFGSFYYGLDLKNKEERELSFSQAFFRSLYLSLASPVTLIACLPMTILPFLRKDKKNIVDHLMGMEIILSKATPLSTDNSPNNVVYLSEKIEKDTDEDQSKKAS